MKFSSQVLLIISSSHLEPLQALQLTALRAWKQADAVQALLSM
jgi:hypothetical protein